MRNFTKLIYLLSMLYLLAGTAYAQGSLVKDIRSGSSSSSPQYLTEVNGTLFFSAYNGTNGEELWKSDGTEAGTVLVKDIRESGSSYPQYLANMNGTLFFSANNGTHGYELWKSDGTSAGTVLVKDIAAGSGGAEHLTEVNGTLFFQANDGSNGTELWKSDGTEAGTVLVRDIVVGNGGSYPQHLSKVNGTLFFQANDGKNGPELWKSDGSEAGTVLVKDILPGSGGSGPRRLTEVNGTLFFEANDGSNGYELWKSDGSEAGTVLVRDIVVGNGHSLPSYLTEVNGTLFFRIYNGSNGYELWKSDGTAEGTVPVDAVNNKVLPDTITNLFPVGDFLYFVASSGTEGRELWRTDGTAEGTYLVADINPGIGSSHPSNFASIGHTLYFQANDGVSGAELWKFEPSCLEVTLSPFAAANETNAPFALSGGSPAGGTYSGTGVTNGMFDPSAVGVGNYEIIYSYTDPTTYCSDTASQYITVTPAIQGNTIVSFTLVNADTDTDIMELTDGTQLYLHALPNAPLNIRTNTDPTVVGSVFMSLSGPIDKNQKESVAPYALFGDENGDYGGQNFGIGNYKITATPYTKANLKGEKGASLTVNFTIKEKVLDCAGFSAALTDVQEVSTCGGNDGSATVGVTGYVGVVTYQWSHGATTATASNLPIGDYTITVSDAQDCSTTLSVTIQSPTLPEVTLAPFTPVKETDAAFALSGGSPAGGTYGGGAVSQGMFDPSIGPGSYEIRYIYTDPTTHCADSAIRYITVEPAIQGEAVVSFTLVNADTDTDILELTDGMRLNRHELPNVPLNIRANTNPPVVGSVFISLSGPVNKNQKESVAPYALFGDENGNYGGQNFGVGNYTLSGTSYSKANLKGEKGVKLSLDFEIVEEVLDCAGFSTSLTDVQEVSTCGGNDGSATISVTSSAEAITYEWSHGATTATASNLTVGDYTVTVRDAQGCSTTLSVIIGSPSLPEVTLAPFSAVNEGYPAFTLTGGSPAGGIYSGTGVSNGEFDPFSLEEGNYEITYTYTDPNTHCSGSESQWILVKPLILGIPVHVASFYLVNADTDRDIMELTEGLQINLRQLPDAPLNIRAETYPSTVNYVILSLSGSLQATRKEGVAPYALFGDENGNYGGENFGPGSYTLSATPYTLDQVYEEKEEMGLSINFTIADNQSLNLRTSTAQDDELVKKIEEGITQQHKEIEVYPNPFLNSIQMSISDSNTESVEVYLIDLYGKTVFSENMEAASGELEINVEGKNIPAGTYILKVIWNENVEMIKMIKQN